MKRITLRQKPAGAIFPRGLRAPRRIILLWLLPLLVTLGGCSGKRPEPREMSESKKEEMPPVGSSQGPTSVPAAEEPVHAEPQRTVRREEVRKEEGELGSRPLTRSAPPPRAPVSTEAAPADRSVKKVGIVKLFFATDRKWTGATEQPKWFGADWSGRQLSYGTCLVWIPPKHEPGKVEKPSVFKLEFRENPEKHVIVEKPKRLEETPYFAALRAEITERPQKEITIFIHGFNNTFDAAASRLGVLTFDMDFNGVPVLYSWSSEGGGWGGTAAYLRDEEHIRLTIQSLAGFLARVATEGRAAGATRINVVAHSMGNRALVEALETLARDHPGTLFLDEVVLAAPDVMELGFADGVWPTIKKPAKRYTLYASSDDKALIASKDLHDGARIGQAGDALLLLDGLDTVDATGCDFSMLGLNHSYFGSPEVVEDLKALLSKALSPAARKLREQKRQTLLYWLLPQITSPNP